MGLERPCRAHLQGRRIDGVAHLEPTELRFTGRSSLRIPLGTGVRATAKAGRLDVEWPDGAASFDLGDDVETWALKIRYPRGRLDKLGVTADTSVAIVGLNDPTFGAEVRARTSDVTTGRIRGGTRLAVVAVQELKDLDRLTAHRNAIVEDGAIWVLWAKGQKALTETHVRAAALAQGLVDCEGDELLRPPERAQAHAPAYPA